MKVFFYGLFMDEALLASKGINPARVDLGFVDGLELRVGERATLLRCPGSRVYGLLMDISASDVEALYEEESVADYRPEPVLVELPDGNRIEARCYNLPSNKVVGVNKDYAVALLRLATQLGLPETYLEQIRNAL